MDPTPQTRTALKLMALDPYPAIYLGRPCYHHKKTATKCESKWWTSHRYSKEVVESLFFAIKQVTANTQKITVIGFSGGGTLSMLIAPYLPQVSKVITINGNLDIEYWTQLHGFSDLYGSLNPATSSALNSSVSQFHLLGSADKNIDAAHIKKSFANRPSTQIRIFNGYSHHCCWQDIWFNTLQNIRDKNSFFDN